jgi:hypothetical protein
MEVRKNLGAVREDLVGKGMGRGKWLRRREKT